MKITYLWTQPSGYMYACIQELVRRGRHDVTLLSKPASMDAPFADSAQPWHRTLTPCQQSSYDSLREALAELAPDVVVFAGWSQPSYVRLVYDRTFARSRFVLAADTAIRFDWRQFIARGKIGRLLHRLDAICVPGERSFQVMRYWKVPEHKIYRLLYGIDYPLFADASRGKRERNEAQSRSFLFAGRYVEAKGLEVLLAAYHHYRQTVDNPWTLECCGQGALKHLLAGRPGVVDRGFQQPASLANVFRDASVFVLPSSFEPWGQVLVEAAAAAMPVICTQACGAAPEIVRSLYNGLIVPTNDVFALAGALRWMHDHESRLPAMGTASQQLARPFGVDAWADNQEMMFEQIVAATS